MKIESVNQMAIRVSSSDKNLGWSTINEAACIFNMPSSLGSILGEFLYFFLIVSDIFDQKTNASGFIW